MEFASASLPSEDKTENQANDALVLVIRHNNMLTQVRHRLLTSKTGHLTKF